MTDLEDRFNVGMFRHCMELLAEVELAEWAETPELGVKDGDLLSGLAGNWWWIDGDLRLCCGWLWIWDNEALVICGKGDVQLKDDEVELGAVGALFPPVNGVENDNNGETVGEELIDIIEEPDGGFMRFSFWRRLQNQTRTTSFSIHNESANNVISSEVGCGCCRNALSSDTRTVVSILVLFFLLLPLIDSGVEWELLKAVGLLSDASASSNHLCSNGFNLHIFLKLKFNASKREIVVWLKSLPYNLPIAKPTSPWVKPRFGFQYFI